MYYVYPIFCYVLYKQELYWLNFGILGVDPIQEAIMEYNRSRQGRALPPDIYLGLRFADANGQPPTPDLHQGVACFFLFKYMLAIWISVILIKCG